MELTVLVFVIDRPRQRYLKIKLKLGEIISLQHR